jgi:hypothetical protein
VKPAAHCDYAKLSVHLERMLAVPRVAATVDIDPIKRGYYAIKALNPTRIVPPGPELPFSVPAPREPAWAHPPRDHLACSAFGAACPAHDLAVAGSRVPKRGTTSYTVLRGA